MKAFKKMIGAAAAFACALSAAMPVGAAATNNPVISDNNFRYYYPDNKYSRDQFLLESDLASPDFMVVGIQHNAKTGELFGYWITPISDKANNGLGTLYRDVVTSRLNKTELKVGDLLSVDGNVTCAAIYPTYYIFNDLFNEATIDYIGYGPDIFGDNFYQVIRQQIVLMEKGVDTTQTLYDIPLITGDADASGDLNVLDCIKLTKYIHGGTALCDYAKITSDINQDGEIDAFDLGLLKNRILKER